MSWMDDAEEVTASPRTRSWRDDAIEVATHSPAARARMRVAGANAAGAQATIDADASRPMGDTIAEALTTAGGAAGFSLDDEVAGLAAAAREAMRPEGGYKERAEAAEAAYLRASDAQQGQKDFAQEDSPIAAGIVGPAAGALLPALVPAGRIATAAKAAPSFGAAVGRGLRVGAPPGAAGGAAGGLGETDTLEGTASGAVGGAALGAALGGGGAGAGALAAKYGPGFLSRARALPSVSGTARAATGAARAAVAGGVRGAAALTERAPLAAGAAIGGVAGGPIGAGVGAAMGSELAGGAAKSLAAAMRARALRINPPKTPTLTPTQTAALAYRSAPGRMQQPTSPALEVPPAPPAEPIALDRAPVATTVPVAAAEPPTRASLRILPPVDAGPTRNPWGPGFDYEGMPIDEASAAMLPASSKAGVWERMGDRDRLVAGRPLEDRPHRPPPYRPMEARTDGPPRGDPAPYGFSDKRALEAPKANPFARARAPEMRATQAVKPMPTPTPQQLAEAILSLPPSKRGEALRQISATLGRDVAKQAADAAGLATKSLGL